jgi:hypothetical protein
VQVTEGNMSFETAKAFKLQAEDPNQKMSMLKIPIHAHGFSTSTYTPMECLNIDFIGPFPDGGYVLVIVDTFTRWVQLYHTKDASALSAAQYIKYRITHKYSQVYNID